MGLRDSFRSLRSGGARERLTEEPIGGDLPPATWFRPRTDGWYVGGPEGSPEYLRFLPTRRVLLLPDEAAAATPPPGAPSGEYTGGGRFSVQARFDRPVVYAVAEPDQDAAPATDAGTGSGDVPGSGPTEVFSARRTDTRPGGGTDAVTYRFRPFPSVG